MADFGSTDLTVLVLDGGFSSQISRHVGRTADGDPLWSARFLQTHPDQVTNTHLDFLRAGADAILTDTYQASIGGFVKHLGVTEQEGYALIRRAVDFAKKARDTFMQECAATGLNRRPPLIVGSVGPYGAHLHDGSEYDGNYADRTDTQTMKDWHKPRIKTLIESGVDLLAFETIPCQKEAEMLVELLKEFPTSKAWLSFSCKDDETLAHGENFQKVAKSCWNANPAQLVAIGVNCCSPKIVSNLFRGINGKDDEKPIPFVTYPNSGEKYKPDLGWVEGSDCGCLADYVQEWLDLGVRYVGGCCRTYDTDIAKIRAQVQSWLDKDKKQRT